MKDKRIIVHKNEKIKKFAYGLRGFLVKAIMEEWSRLGEEQMKIRLGSKREVKSLSDWSEVSRLKNEASVKYRDIENERSVLYRALNNSICICAGCNQTDRDMYYNAYAEGWYCTLCVQEYRDFYHKNKAILDQGGFVGDFDENFHESFL